MRLFCFLLSFPIHIIRQCLQLIVAQSLLLVICVMHMTVNLGLHHIRKMKKMTDNYSQLMAIYLNIYKFEACISVITFDKMVWSS